MKLRLSQGLELPLDAVTQTFAILGVRGTGKTNTGVVLVEELLAAHQQVVVLDPVDVWWGIKSSASGPGFPVPVIGGDYGDVPLEATAGQLIADFVVDNRASAVLSLRHLGMNEQRRFAAEFARRLYDRKGRGNLRSPLMLVIDEADEFAPQRIPPGGEAMFGAFDRLVRRGRSSGIGVTLISQRPQVLNKDVLTQMEILISHRVLHKLDRKALEEWVAAHDAKGKGDEFLGSLSTLNRGEAWVWSPSFLDIFQRVQIRQRKTFDSSATPKAGEQQSLPTVTAPVDLEKLRESIRETIERTKEDDPRELRAKIAELKRALESRIDKPILEDSQIQGLRESIEALDRAIVRVVECASPINAALLNLPSRIVHQLPIFEERIGSLTIPEAMERPKNGSLGRAERSILRILSQYPKVGRTKVQIAIMAGYAHEGGGFNNALSRLRTAKLIYGSEPIKISPSGISEIGPVEKLPHGSELLLHWCSKLGRAERSILETLSRYYPATLTKENLAELTGYEPSGGGFNNALSKLRTLELIQGRGDLMASEVFFQ